MRVAIQDDREARTIVERAMGVKIFEPFAGVVFFDDTKTVGAAIFNNYTKWDVHFSCVSTGLLDMRFARHIARYVFATMGCHRCTAITRRSNVAARKALEQLGFQHEGVMREYFPDSDGLVYGLLRSEQRLLRNLK